MFDIQSNVCMNVFFEQAGNLLYEHWEELALNKEFIPLSPDKNKFKSLQDNGTLHNLVAYHNSNVIGYSIVFINPHIHYSTSIVAHVDVIYVSKNYRGTSVGARLLIETEKTAKLNGAKVITHHAKEHVPNIVNPLKKLGYSLYENIYGKYIG